MGVPALALSAVGGATGAVMYWTSAFQTAGFRFSAIGLNVMIVGAIGFIVSTSIVAVSRHRSGGSRQLFDRHVVNGDGRTSSFYEVSP